MNNYLIAEFFHKIPPGYVSVTRRLMLLFDKNKTNFVLGYGTSI